MSMRVMAEQLVAVGVRVGRWRPSDIKRAAAAAAIVCDGMISRVVLDDEDNSIYCGPGARGCCVASRWPDEFGEDRFFEFGEDRSLCNSGPNSTYSVCLFRFGGK